MDDGQTHLFQWLMSVWLQQIVSRSIANSHLKR